MPVAFFQRLFGGATTEKIGTALIVDSDDAMRELVSVHAESIGYLVKKVKTSDDALRALERGLKATVLLVNLKLDGEDGFTFGKKLRADKAMRCIPIIFVNTCFPPHQVLNVENKVNNCKVLQKPISAKKLEIAIADLKPVVYRTNSSSSRRRRPTGLSR